MWKYNQNLKCFLKDNRNVDVCEYWVYHSVMDKKRCSYIRLHVITRGCIWVERDVIDERKITTVYDRQIWSGRSFTGTDYRIDGSVTCIHIFICIFPGKYFILAWPRIVNLFLFQNTLTECVKALRREPEIFKCEIPGSGKEKQSEKTLGTAQYLPFL